MQGQCYYSHCLSSVSHGLSAIVYSSGSLNGHSAQDRYKTQLAINIFIHQFCLCAWPYPSFQSLSLWSLVDFQLLDFLLCSARLPIHRWPISLPFCLSVLPMLLDLPFLPIDYGLFTRCRSF